MITEDYVSFEVAKLLKEKGFKGQGEHFYEDNKITNYINYWPRITPKQRYEAIEAPTIQMAMKWLRDTHKIHIQVEAIVPEYYEKDEYVYRFHYKRLKHIPIYNNMSYIDDTQYASYEQACEAAIKHCLENLI